MSIGADPLRPPTPARPPERRFPLLDGVRVIAMFGVLAVHADTSARATSTGVIHHLAKRGDAAVPLFLMLSAFLAFRPMVLAHIDQAPVPAVGAYLGRRLLRIFPGYWVVLAILVGIDAVSLSGFREYALAITLAYPLFESPFANSNFLGLGQTWVVVLLFQIYLLIPVLGVIARRLLPAASAPGTSSSGEPGSLPEWQRWLLGWCALFGFVGLACRSVLSFGTWAGEVRAVVLLPVWLDVVAPGLALAVVVAAYERGYPLPRPVAIIARHPLIGWIGAIVAYGVAAVIAVPDQIGALEPEYSLRYVLYALVSILALSAAVLTKPGDGRIAGVLSSRAMRLLSLGSIGFFVGHLAVMGKVESALGYEPFRAQFFPLVAVTIPVSLVIAAIAYHLAEKPAAKWTDGHLRGRR